MEPNSFFTLVASRVLAESTVFGKLITTENAMHQNQHSISPKRLLAAFVTILILTAGLSAPALAGDNKVYAGSTCKPVEETGTTGLYYGNNTTNLGAVDVDVVCPVVRDVTTGAAPNAYIDVNSSSVSCTVVVSNADGLGTFDTGSAAPVLLAAGVYRIDIQGVSQVSQGSYHIACNLPPTTAILRYSVAE